MEQFIKHWILEDVYPNIDQRQFGDEKGTGCEHVLVYFVDRVLSLLDSTNGKSAVLMASCDWVSAFDCLDPHCIISGFIRLGLRPSLIQLLISYMSGRSMKVKWRGVMSAPRSLVGGSAQGTLLGGCEYIVSTSTVASDVPFKDKYRYYDDLQILELVMLSGLLKDYDFWTHVPSDIGVDSKYLPTNNIQMQQYLNNICDWSTQNEVQLNEKKSNYMIFTRCQSEFTVRLQMNYKSLEQVKAIKLLGLWVTQDMSWQTNTQEACKKAYSRLALLTKLKYVGVGRTDLLDVYKLFIRSCLEYCSVVFHTMLTLEQSRMYENCQRVSLKVIMAGDYADYESALRSCSLDTLYKRWENRVLQFSLRALKHPKHSKMFPLSNKFRDNVHDLREHERYIVNFTHGEKYKSSFIPQAQRRLNQYVKEKA